MLALLVADNPAILIVMLRTEDAQVEKGYDIEVTLLIIKYGSCCTY